MDIDHIASESGTAPTIEEKNKKVTLRAEDLAFGYKHPFKTFELEFDVYLKDTNAYGNVYFSRHAEWQGVLR